MKLSVYFPVLLPILSYGPATVAVEASTAGPQERRRKTEAHGAHNTVGLSVNGGSNTAANGCASVMLGFQRQKLLINGEERPAIEAFDVISGLSAGNVPNAIYHYAQNTNSDELLETSFVSDPSKITMEDLTTAPSEKSMFRRFTTDPLPFIAMALLYNAVYGVPAWPVFMYFMLLQPYGIRMGTLMTEISIREGVKSTPIFATSMIGPAGELFPSWVYTQMNKGWVEHHHDTLRESGGYKEFTEEDDPEFVAHMKILHPTVPGFGTRKVDISKLFALAKTNGFELPIPAFGTDKDFHIPFAANTVMKFETENVTAKPLNFKPFVATYDELSSESNPFTLEKMVGMATEIIVLFGLGSIFPNFEGNPIAIDIPTADGSTRKMAFSDGGYNDYTGIPALVQQKTKKIISVINPSSSMTGHTSGTPTEIMNLPVHKVMTINLHHFFGIGGDELSAESFNAAHTFNHMFNLYSNGENQMTKLINNFSSLQDAGEPLITTLEGLEVIDNPLYGIEGGWTLDLTIMMMSGVPQKFADQIPPGIAPPPIGKNMTENGFFTNEEFASVPNVMPVHLFAGDNYTYTIPGTNQTIELPGIPAAGMHLPLKAARMTQILNSWVVERAWDGLIGSDGEEKFAGFRKLLEESNDDNDDGGAEEDTSGSYSANAVSYSICFAVMLSSAALLLL